MKTIHLLRVGAEMSGALEPLLASASAAGERIGWLELREPPATGSLGEATAAGAFRAVAVGSGGSVAVKVRRGPAVLTDLLREHFLGCRLVLVQGEGGGELARLQAVADGWRIESAAGAWTGSTDEFLARLRRPAPW